MKAPHPAPRGGNPPPTMTHAPPCAQESDSEALTECCSRPEHALRGCRRCADHALMPDQGVGAHWGLDAPSGAHRKWELSGTPPHCLQALLNPETEPSDQFTQSCATRPRGRLGLGPTDAGHPQKVGRRECSATRRRIGWLQFPGLNCTLAQEQCGGPVGRDQRSKPLSGCAKCQRRHVGRVYAQ